MILEEAREFVNFYRAIETFALSRHSNSCGNLSLNICWGTVPPSSPSSSPSCFLNVSPSTWSYPSFLLHELHFPSFFNSWRIKFFPLCLVANSKSNTIVINLISLIFHIVVILFVKNTYSLLLIKKQIFDFIRSSISLSCVLDFKVKVESPNSSNLFSRRNCVF